MCDCIYCQASRIDHGEPAVVQKEGEPKKHEYFTYCDCRICLENREKKG